jgi:hypothetical protein
MSDGNDTTRREAVARTALLLGGSIAYMALTARAADYAVNELKKRNI